jgi:hypothetical protein
LARSEAEWVAWAKAKRAAFQVAPLLESVQGERLQVGFSITLYAAAPLEAAPGSERRAAIEKLRDEIQELADDVAPPEQRTARVQLEQSARVVLRPENEFRPEVDLTLHLFPRGASGSAVGARDRERMSQLEKRLLAFGVKQGRA